MLGRAWGGVLAAGVLPLVEYRYQWGSEVDQDFYNEGTARSMPVALVVSQVMSRSGVWLPDTDERLAAVLGRRGVQCAPWTRWCLAELPGPRFGVVSHHGVIESNGENLVLVESQEQGRYTGFWEVPGVYYVPVGDSAGGAGRVFNR